MTDKASPAGWVIQVTIPAKPRDPGAPWRASKVLGPPSFQYFNVAIADFNKAVAATMKRSGATEESDVAAVRSLSSREIVALNLKTGEVKPA